MDVKRKIKENRIYGGIKFFDEKFYLFRIFYKIEEIFVEYKYYRCCILINIS